MLTNSRNTETEGNDKVQADRNNQNVIYDQTEIDEDREQSREQRAVWRVYFRKSGYTMDRRNFK